VPSHRGFFNYEVNDEHVLFCRPRERGGTLIAADVAEALLEEASTEMLKARLFEDDAAEFGARPSLRKLAGIQGQIAQFHRCRAGLLLSAVNHVRGVSPE
jgi:hypothetical protein